MNARKRYDTTALIQDLKTDRRRGIGLTIAALLVILVLVGIYVSQIGGGAPEVPGDATPTRQNAAEKSESLKDAMAEEAPPSAAEPTEPTDTATEDETAEEAAEKVAVEILLPRKTQLWVDETSIGKVKKHTLELDAGAHTFRAKFGKKTISHEDTLQAGAKVQVIFQPKKKKALTRTVEDDGEATDER